MKSVTIAIRNKTQRIIGFALHQYQFRCTHVSIFAMLYANGAYE